MTLSVDWSAEIAGTLVLGAGTNSRILTRGTDWWGNLGADTQAIPRAGRDGAVFASQRQRTRTVTFALVLNNGTSALASAALTTLRSTWQPRQADTTVDVRVPGAPETTMRAYGRCGRLDVDQSWNTRGAIWATAQFDLSDPLWYGAQATHTSTTSPVIVTNSGTATTLRATVLVSGNGGTPVVSNSGDGGVITWSAALAVGAPRSIDLLAQTVTSGATDKTAETANTSTWFTLPPGANSIHFQGCSGATVVVRSAWW